MDKDFIKIIDSIEGYYNRKLNDKEIKALSEELKSITFEEFENEIKFSLLKKIEYFTVSSLYKIIEEFKELREFKKSLGVKSFDELYEN